MMADERSLNTPADVSRAAGDSIDRARLRGIVLEAIRKGGAHGRTCDEIEVLELLTHQTCSARVHELAGLKQITDSGMRRPTRSGRKAVVWVVA